MVFESELGSIVCEAMRMSEADGIEVPLRGGYNVDSLNLTASCFTVFAPLDKTAAMMARGKVDTFGFLIQEAHGKRLRSKVTFFSCDAEAKVSLPLFNKIVEEWKNSCFNLDEAVLVHVTHVDFELGDARVVVVARRALKV